jgi:hypothetical protein
VGADLNGYLERPLGAKAPLEGFGSGTQPALLDNLTAFVIQQAEIAILVSQIQPGRHFGRSFATIVHGPILLP